MKQALTALLGVLLFAAIVVLAAEETTKESAVDTFIAKTAGDYEKAVIDANAFYEKYTAPMRKRCGVARDKKIIAAGSNAIKRLTSTRKGVSERNGARMEQEIEKIRASIDEQVGNAPTVTPKKSVMGACSASFKGHTYMAINSKVNWKEASVRCKKMGGHLVYIETAEEMAFVLKAFRGHLWLGATDAHKEGDWRWGNRKPVARDLWFKGEPNNSMKRQHYAVLQSRESGRLLDDIRLNAGRVAGFICEWE